MLELIYHGEPVRLVRVRRMGRIRLARDPRRRWTLTVPEGVEPASAAQFLAAYERPERGSGVSDERLKALQAGWSARLGLGEVRLEIVPLPGCWGKCLFDGPVILINEAARRLPERAAEELLVHELCHLRVKDHRPAFWQMMTEVMPDWAAREGTIRALWREMEVKAACDSVNTKSE